MLKLTFGTMTDEERAKLAAQLRGGNQQPQGQAQFHGGPAAASPLAAGSKTTFIAVTSGKGGVGKSTVTVNLAVALARQGKKVGIIDADIYGFSVPDMMGIEQRPTVIDDIILRLSAMALKLCLWAFSLKITRQSFGVDRCLEKCCAISSMRFIGENWIISYWIFHREQGMLRLMSIQ